ncbi:TPA: hemagglutinin repeat-containing protein, partial [Haemophilus influenzae]
VTATEKFTNTATGNLTGHTDVAVSAKDANVAGTVTAEAGKASVVAQNKATISGAVSGQDVELEGKKGLTINQDATVTATEDNVMLKGSSIEQKGTVKAKQNATLEGGTITNSGTVKAETGKVGVTATENFTNTETGNLTGHTDVTVSANDANVAGTVTAEEGKASVVAQDTVTITGTVSGKNVELEGKNNLTINENAEVTATEGDATLAGKNISNSGTVKAEKGKVGVTATEKFTNTETGNLKGNTGVAVETKDADIAGTVTADTGDLTITAKNDAIIKGTLDAKTGAASITATNDLSIKEGSKVSGGSVGLKAGENLDVAKNAQVTATEGDATLAGKNVNNSGTVTASNDVSVTATENFTNTETGNLTGNNVDVKAKNALNEGEIQAEEGNLTVKADETFVNTESGILDAKAKVEVKAEDATIAGEISGGVVSLTADKTLDIAKDSFVTAKTGEAKLSGDTVTNAGTVVAKEGEVSVNA